ncbi:MAG: F0F1 ATP synthase subunit delta [Microbacterium sp.]
MGSATTHARDVTERALNAATVGDLSVARELFVAARTLGESSQLSGALSAWGVDGQARATVAGRVFATLQPTTVELLQVAVAQRWSSTDDLISGVEELAIRAAARGAASDDLEGELFEVSRVVAAHPELELALGRRLGEPTAKGQLISTILQGRASEATILVVSELVQQPRERRVRALLSLALRLVADQRGRTVATVHVAQGLDAAQTTRLRSALSQRYGTDVTLNIVTDASVVGGVRVEIGDDVIDATVSSRINDLRQRLAG